MSRVQTDACVHSTNQHMLSGLRAHAHTPSRWHFVIQSVSMIFMQFYNIYIYIYIYMYIYIYIYNI
jgi:hypothetical protein